MRYTVFGAGSIGTVLAGLLKHAGIDVAIAGRGAVSALRLEGDDETVEVAVPVVAEPEGTILLCVHAPDVDELCRGWRGRTVVTWQNGVTTEATAARSCDVIGGVWRMTCTLTAPGVSLFTRRGRVVIGRHPEGVDEHVQALADDLRAAGFDTGVSPRIAGDKWLKLFLNLTSAPHALIRRPDHSAPEFGLVKAALLEEALAVYQRAGVVAQSGDGRDATPAEEVERHRSGGGRARPVFNSTWRALHLGRRPKELYHDTILDLASGDAPANAAMLRLLERAREPECYTAAEVLSALRDSSGGNSGSS